MRYSTAGFVYRSEADGARAKRKIELFVKGRRVERIQPAQAFEYRLWHQETRSGDAIHNAAIGVCAVIWTSAATDRKPPAAAENAPTGVLNCAVDVQQHWADDGSPRRLLDCFHKRAQPARSHQSVTVEEAKIPAAGDSCTRITGQHEPEILLVCDFHQSFTVRNSHPGQARRDNRRPRQPQKSVRWTWNPTSSANRPRCR